MSNYQATIHWERQADEPFTDNAYSRGHTWEFDGGVRVPASSSPDIVPLPYSVAENVDPEEAFIAALSSCHMLFFLAFAAKKGWVVDHYVDHAIGVLGKDAHGNMAMTQVTLKPHVTFAAATSPAASDIAATHHLAHKKCFIANSVKTHILIELGE